MSYRNQPADVDSIPSSGAFACDGKISTDQEDSLRKKKLPKPEVVKDAETKSPNQDYVPHTVIPRLKKPPTGGRAENL